MSLANSPSLGFCQITNDSKATISQLEKYGKYFDKFFITVADKDKTEFTKLETYLKKCGTPYKLNFFKWVENFGKARLSNQKLIDTDYWFWLDTDDDIDHPEKLRPILDYMAKSDVDMMYFKYDYFKNEHGEGINDHNRERIIRTKANVKWSDVPVHETIIGKYANAVVSQDVAILHNKSHMDVQKSHQRNKELLLKHFEKTKDPRSAYYLGEIFLASNDPTTAAKYYKFLVENGGWDEEKYDAWMKLSDCLYKLGDFNQSITCTFEAIKLFPNKPDAYYMNVLIYSAIQQLDKAIEWAEVAMTKKQPNTLRMVDPTLTKYRGPFMVAQAYLFSGRVREAFALFQEIKKTAPYFVAQYEKETNTNWTKFFEEAYYDQKATDYTKYLIHYTKDYGGRPERLFEGLPSRLFGDVRLAPERSLIYPPKKWPDKSIAIFCGQGIEHWGPDTLEKGMGGSEEAVVYLSRELAKQGWQVTVFNDREEEYIDEVKQEEMYDNGPTDSGRHTVTYEVVYKPWTLFNPEDTFDVFIAHRRPEICKGVKARVKVVDLHDTIDPEVVYACLDSLDKVFVKTKYHRSLYPKAPDEKFVIVGNAIVKEQFK